MESFQYFIINFDICRRIFLDTLFEINEVSFILGLMRVLYVFNPEYLLNFIKTFFMGLLRFIELIEWICLLFLLMWYITLIAYLIFNYSILLE